MTRIKLQIDRFAYKTKPEGEYGIIKPRVQKSLPVELPLQELMTKISQGYTTSPAVLDGGLSADFWKEQQLFFVDIDNDNDTEELLRPDDALKIAKANHLEPAFYYPTFSHTELKPKFRVAFVCEKVITNPSERSGIIEGLVSLFAQADNSCKNADKMFLGTCLPCVAWNLDARFTTEQAISVFVPPVVESSRNPQFANPNHSDNDLERLKRDFDFLGYLAQRNGETRHNNGKSAMFKKCELCGGHDDLVYYHASNSFMCFNAKVHKGGSIVDYLMIAEKLNLADAIAKFKHDLCKIEKPQFTKSQKRDFAIRKNTDVNSDLVEHLKELQPHAKYQWNDKGLGALFGDVYKNLARYNVTAKEWYYYDGKVWKRDNGNMQASRFAKELSDALLVFATMIQDEEKKRNYVDFVNKLGKLGLRETMIRDSRDCNFIEHADLDKGLYLFNCQNGTLDLETFEFQPHDPSDLLSKISNVHYDHDARSPLFEGFIDQVMQGNKEKIEYLQKAFGYALTGDTRLESCFILYGATTRNGKSSLVETISYMMGNTAGYAMNMKPESLAARHNTDSRQANGDIARLVGCRFLNASEPPKRMVLDSALLKLLTGNDSITARHLHEREFEFNTVFKMFINTNFLPLITDDTLFTSGRINVITFDRHFAPHEQNRNLKNLLKKQENISGLFNWCLAGLRKFYKDGLTPPQSITNATSEYRTNSDKVGNFVAECLEDSVSNCSALSVYTAYQEWCKSNGYGSENKRNFYAELKTKKMFAEQGTVDGKTVKNIVKGYRLIPQDEPKYQYNDHGFIISD